MILFFCSSVFHIINAINIKWHLHPDEDADLLLDGLADFSELIEPLKKCGFFRSIQIPPYKAFHEHNKGRWGTANLDIENPESFIGSLKFDREYNDYYCFVSSVYDKIIYYTLVKRGMNPRLHIAEEGISSYVTSIRTRSRSDQYDHKLYGKNAYMDNISSLLLYEPDLYCVGEGFPVQKIPKLDATNSAMMSIFSNIFGSISFPQEKYIFLEESFLKDKILATDKSLLNQVAEFVGMDNIVIKLHPRNTVDTWSSRGFKTLGITNVPWEIAMLSNDIAEKTFITVSSGAALSALISMSKNVKILLLYEMIDIGENAQVKQKYFRNFIQKAKTIYNNIEPQIFTPSGSSMLQESLKYLNRRLK